MERCQQILGLEVWEELKDNEAVEWAELSLDLAPIVLSRKAELSLFVLPEKADLLKWLPSAEVVFSLESLMKDIGEKAKAINPTLAKTIWKGNHPKKVKIFLWKIAHKSIRASENLPKK